MFGMDALGFIIGFAIGYRLMTDWIRRTQHGKSDRTDE